MLRQRQRAQQREHLSKHHQDPPEILCPFFCSRGCAFWSRVEVVCALFPQGRGGEFWVARQGELAGGVGGASGWRRGSCVEVCCAAEAGVRGLVASGGGGGGGPWRRWAWTVLGGSVELGRSWSAGGLTLRGACCALLGGCSNFALRFARAWYDLGMALERAS